MFKTTILYRPVGLKEWKLILASNCEAFPPRLNWQPIFYPVLDKAYAEKIAHDWNTVDAGSDYIGIVTQFNVNTDFLADYKVENVGAKNHNELWIPAEKLVDFNANIIGKIKAVNAFFGAQFKHHEEVKELYQKF